MLVQTQTGQAYETSGVTRKGAFKLQEDAQMYDLLGNLLYTRKAEAAIREPSCNAFDAHTDAGVTEPFVVVLPTKENPTFKIIDFGKGMSEETLYELYPTYGWSDKRNSQRQIGGYGLGSKAPISYLKKPDGECRPFTVESVHEGLLNVVMCMTNEHGVPVLDGLVSNEPTDRHSGVTVSFVVEEDDIDKFRATALKVLGFFEHKPTLRNGVFPVLVNKVEHGQMWIREGSSHPLLVLANVAYPVPKTFAQTPAQTAWLKAGVCVRRAFGPRIMSPARETLFETKVAIDYVMTAYQEEISALHQDVLALFREHKVTEVRRNALGYRRALMAKNWHRVPTIEEEFIKLGATADEAKACAEVSGTEYSYSLDLPPPLKAACSWHEFYLTGWSFTPRKDNDTGNTTFYGNLTLIDKAGQIPKPTGGKKRSTERLDYRVPMCWGEVVSEEVVLIIDDDASCKRRMESELFRRNNAAHNSGQKYTVPPGALLLSMYGRRTPEKIEELKELARRAIESSPDFANARIVLATEWELEPHLLTKNEQMRLVEDTAAKEKVKEVFPLRGAGQLFVSSERDENRYSSYSVHLMEAAEVVDSGKFKVFQPVSGLSWRRGRATNFKAVEGVGAPVGTPVTDLDHIGKLYATLGYATPAVVWTTNGKLQKNCTETGLVSFLDDAFAKAQEKLATYSPMTRKLAWFDLFASSDFYAKPWVWVLGRSGGIPKAFLDGIEGTKGHKALLKAIPELVNIDEFDHVKHYECREIFQKMRNAVMKPESLYLSPEGKLISSTEFYDLIKVLEAVHKAAPQVSALSVGIDKGATGVVRLNLITALFKLKEQITLPEKPKAEAEASA